MNVLVSKTFFFFIIAEIIAFGQIVRSTNTRSYQYTFQSPHTLPNDISKKLNQVKLQPRYIKTHPLWNWIISFYKTCFNLQVSNDSQGCSKFTSLIFICFEYFSVCVFLNFIFFNNLLVHALCPFFSINHKMFLLYFVSVLCILNDSNLFLYVNIYPQPIFYIWLLF